MAQKRLMQELQALQKEKWVTIEVRAAFAEASGGNDDTDFFADGRN